MLDGQFGVAIAVGMAATVNPCGFALLPAYLAAFVGDDHHPGVGAVPRAFAVSAAMTGGFVVVFGLFGAIITPLALSVEEYLPWATIVIGIVLVALGIKLLAGGQFTLAIPKLNKGGSSGSITSMFLFGLSYAVASLSCTIGPFLAITTTTFRSGSFVSGVGVFLAYALGMGAIVTVLTVGVALARNGVAGRLRSALPYINRISGAMLVLAGAYVAWYGWFEIRTLNGGDGQDPLVNRAIDVQSWLQNRIVPGEPVVALAWLVGALAVLAGGVVLFKRLRSGGPGGDGPRAGDSDGVGPVPADHASADA